MHGVHWFRCVTISFLRSLLPIVIFENLFCVCSYRRLKSAFCDRSLALLWFALCLDLLAEALFATLVQSQHLGSQIHMCGKYLVIHFVLGRKTLLGAAMFCLYHWLTSVTSDIVAWTRGYTTTRARARRRLIVICCITCFNLVGGFVNFWKSVWCLP